MAQCKELVAIVFFLHAASFAQSLRYQVIPVGMNNEQAKAINNRCQVVGSFGVPSGGFHAFLQFDCGALPIDLGTLPGHANSSAADINNNSHILGNSGMSENRIFGPRVRSAGFHP